MLDFCFSNQGKYFCRQYYTVESLPSKEDTWTCGVWLAANEWQLEPTEAYFVFPKQNRIECPVSAYKERSEVAENCKRLGQNRIADREHKVLKFNVIPQAKSGRMCGAPRWVCGSGRGTSCASWPRTGSTSPPSPTSSSPGASWSVIL